METDVDLKDLEIEEDLPFQRKQFLFERIGWLAMAALVIAALAGAFGRGPVSKSSVGEREGPVWIQYERVGRLQSQTEMLIHVAADASSGDDLAVQVNSDFARNVEMIELSPKPDHEIVATDGITYHYRRRGKGAVQLKFVYEPSQPGSLHAEVRAASQAPLTFSQYVLP